MKNAQSLLTRLLLQFGALLLAGLVIWLLSGGFPPANWQLLTLVLLHYPAYQAAQGSSLQRPLLILSIQSVLLAIVWIWWLVLAIRELSAFLKGSSQASPARQRPLVPILPIASIKAIAAPKAAGNAPGTHKNPFENLARRRHQSGTITLGKAAEAKKEQQRQARIEALAAEAKKEQQRQAQLIADEQKQVSPTSNLSGQLKPTDPFAVQPDLMDLFDAPDLQSAPSLNANQAGQGADVVDQFVFGDPFEGPLPEVFEYDADLKQSLSDKKQTGPMPDASKRGRGKPS